MPTTNFPTSIDSYSTKTNGQIIQPDDINNPQGAIIALETKVGVDGSAVTTTIDYLLKNTSSVSPGHKHTTADLTDAASFVPTGAVLPYAGSTAPTNFLFADGTAVSRATYAVLLSVIGTTYGAGDGINTFNLPNLCSRIPVGVGTGTKVLTFVSRSSDTITISGVANSSTNENQTGQPFLYVSTGSAITGLTSNTTYYLIRIAYNQFKLATSVANAVAGTAISLSSDGTGTQTFTQTFTTRALGDTGGEETHALVVAEIPAHTHTQGNTGSSTFTGGGTAGNGNTGSTGGSTAHSVMNPFLSLNYIIRI